MLNLTRLQYMYNIIKIKHAKELIIELDKLKINTDTILKRMMKERRAFITKQKRERDSDENVKIQLCILFQLIIS